MKLLKRQTARPPADPRSVLRPFAWAVVLGLGALAGCSGPLHQQGAAAYSASASASAPAVAPAPPPAPAPATTWEYSAINTKRNASDQRNVIAYATRDGISANDVGALHRNVLPELVAGARSVAPFAIALPSTEKFASKEVNNLKLVADEPVSTFSVDVDTASYAYVRRVLTSGRLPPAEAVRVEEMVNYFPYKYATPASRDVPFGVSTELMPSPWKAGNQLLHIAVRGYDIQAAQRPRANVVLLIDVSGSMQPADRLPLLKQGFRLFAQQLRDEDSVSIVTYANGTAVALEPTPGKDKVKIIDAIDGLSAKGGTAGGAGLQRAYDMAERNFDPKAINRIILATDGDFNVGIRDIKELEKFIVEKRKSGIYLSVFGVGLGNLNDALIQRLTQSGNGNAAYIDSLLEARKAMSEELGSTMFPIANDVKVQVEFNPDQVAAYRLIGYETRMLQRQDFNDDKVDAGDMGAGHTVTALYEITPTSAANKLVDPLRYKSETAAKPAGKAGRDEVAFVKLRYKLPGQADSRLIEHAVRASSARKTLDAVPDEQRFAVAVAAFGQHLRDEKQLQDFSYADIAKLANGARGKDVEGYRAEFVRLVRMTETLGAVKSLGQP